MPSIRCPYCQHQAHVTERKDSAVVSSRDPLTVSAAYECDHCHHLVIGSAEVRGLGGETPAHCSFALSQVNESFYEWQPKRAVGKTYEDVPVAIGIPASEAHECFSIQAYRAAVLMARSVLEATAKDNGVTKGNLYEKITELAKNGAIRPIVADAAHEVRLLGNDMAHGDFATTDIDADEAEEVLELMDVFMTEVYQLPTTISRRQAKRTNT
jgi:hypothetical protein